LQCYNHLLLINVSIEASSKTMRQNTHGAKNNYKVNFSQKSMSKNTAQIAHLNMAAF